MGIAIKTKNLGKLYKGNRGIDDLNLEVEKGEIFGFLGPNGAGKTTAMKIMCGLVKPERGDAFLNGYSVTEEYEKAMSKVGCIIESVNVFEHLSAFENMRICTRYYDDIDDIEIDKALDATGILKYRDEKVKGFSLGMKQRLGISMAIASKPEILILDEPLNGMDVEAMVSMRNLFRDLSKNKKVTIFISSHLIHDIELTCDRVGIVNEGKLIKTVSIADVLKDYSSLENYYLSEVDEDERS